MARNHECHQRPEHGEAAKTSPLKMAIQRIVNTNTFLFVLLLGLGILQFGWIFWPPLGIVWNFINGGIISAIFVIGIGIAIIRKFTGSPEEDIK